VGYITAAEYNEITERPQAEATNSRIKHASALLDARIGNYFPDPTTGLKLHLDDLSQAQKDAVKEWVARAVAFLIDNNDAPPSAASISLGRFSVQSSQNQGLPDALSFADSILVSSGLIKRAVNIY